MRQQALRARPRRRRLPPDLGERQVGAVAPNVLGRSFEAPAPNRNWIADFTYVWTAEGWLYVSAVVDLFSRRCIRKFLQNEPNLRAERSGGHDGGVGRGSEPDDFVAVLAAVPGQSFTHNIALQVALRIECGSVREAAPSSASISKAGSSTPGFFSRSGAD
jgi:transposase InsO family protein